MLSEYILSHASLFKGHSEQHTFVLSQQVLWQAQSGHMSTHVSKYVKYKEDLFYSQQVLWQAQSGHMSLHVSYYVNCREEMR